MDFENIINKIRTEIYEYNINYVLKETIKLIEGMYELLNDCDSGCVDKFNNILKNISISMKNEDYQLLGDILKFELQPFINKMV